MQDSVETVLQYLKDYWEFTFFIVVPFVWNRIMWYKRKLIDEVFATKDEVRTALDEVKNEVHTTIKQHADEDYQFQKELRDKMDANHNEIKDLIITHLGDRR